MNKRRSRMRMMLKVSIPVDTGNAAIRDGSIVTKIQSILADLKPEAAYFTEFDGERGAVRGLVGIDDGVVSGVINLESPGVEAPGWRPRHDERYHEA